MDEKKSLPATTTHQEDVTSAGQRKVNLIWEFTQSLISICVTMAMLYCSVKKLDSPEIRDAFFLIIGFYFSRTNHQAIGGVGRKPIQNYLGR